MYIFLPPIPRTTRALSRNKPLRWMTTASYKTKQLCVQAMPHHLFVYYILIHGCYLTKTLSNTLSPRGFSGTAASVISNAGSEGFLLGWRTTHRRLDIIIVLQLGLNNILTEWVLISSRSSDLVQRAVILRQVVRGKAYIR